MESTQPFLLRALSGLPYRESKDTYGVGATILVVGDTLSGKTTFSKILDAIPRKDLQIQIRETRELPLKEDETRPRIDFIIFVIDMTSKSSLNYLQKNINLQFIDAEYFASGKVCILATRGSTPHKWAFKLEELHDITFKYEIPVFVTDFTNENQSLETCSGILRLVEAACMNIKGVSSLLLKTLDLHLGISTVIDQNNK